MTIKNWMSQTIGYIEVKLTANDIEKILTDLHINDLKDIFIEVLESNSNLYDYVEQHFIDKRSE